MKHSPLREMLPIFALRRVTDGQQDSTCLPICVKLAQRPRYAPTSSRCVTDCLRATGINLSADLCQACTATALRANSLAVRYRLSTGNRTQPVCRFVSSLHSDRATRQLPRGALPTVYGQQDSTCPPTSAKFVFVLSSLRRLRNTQEMVSKT